MNYVHYLHDDDVITQHQYNNLPDDIREKYKPLRSDESDDDDVIDTIAAGANLVAGILSLGDNGDDAGGNNSAADSLDDFGGGNSGGAGAGGEW